MTLLVGLAAFVLMEPFTYLAHRFVMHGPGMGLHRSHHRRWPERRPDDPFLEANDAFPVMFAGVTMLALAVGFNVDGTTVLLPVCVGSTFYGIAYAFVHDVYIHGRVGWRRRVALLDRLASAHELHHRFGGEPYGMLAPVVPASVRRRVATADARRVERGAGTSGQRIASAPRP